MTAELQIESGTGVPVALRRVGPGGRAYAFLIDWHIRALLAAAWYVFAAWLHWLDESGSFRLAPPREASAAWTLTVVAPAAAIYFLYHPLIETLWRGSTPGKRIGGVRIVTALGEVPPISSLIIRNVFRLIDSFPGVYCVGLLTTLLTREQLRFGDMAAGTMLVYERANVAPALAADPLAVGQLQWQEAAVELERRWSALHPQRRSELARELLQHAGQLSDEQNDASLHAALRRLAAITEAA